MCLPYRFGGSSRMGKVEVQAYATSLQLTSDEFSFQASSMGEDQSRSNKRGAVEFPKCSTASYSRPQGTVVLSHFLPFFSYNDFPFSSFRSTVLDSLYCDIVHLEYLPLVPSTVSSDHGVPPSWHRSQRDPLRPTTSWRHS